MADIHSTIWPIEEHTKAKHAILRRYLGAWFPILGSTEPKINYIDGFAGPGRYQGGELGSPIIALDLALESQAKFNNSRLFFLFIEERSDRAKQLVFELSNRILPKNFEYRVENNKFEKVLQENLSRLEASGHTMAPTFAFIDPFGWSGLPFEIVKKLLINSKTEVLINFMVDSINRFANHPDAEIRTQIQNLFGVTEDRIKTILQSQDRIGAFRSLYQEQLNKYARYVRYFEMVDERNKPIYDLFFATSHPLGHERMKEAFWKIDPQSGYRFSDRTDPNQPVLFNLDPSIGVAKLIQNMYSGKTSVSEDVIFYVVNETAYTASHARRALKFLLKNDNISVEKIKKDGSKWSHGFPTGTIIHFLIQQ